MSWFDLFVLALALGTDAFSLGVGIGLQGIGWPAIYRASAIIGLFHILMPLAGLLLGQVFGQAAGAVGTTLGALLLMGLGLKMAWEGRREEKRRVSPVAGWNVVVLAFSVSVDALLVGFSLGTFGASLPVAVAMFGIGGGAMAAAGLVSGKRAGSYLAGYAEIIGGLVLFFLGVKFLTQS